MKNTKRRLVALGLSSAMMLTLVTGNAAQNPFTDVPSNHWAYESIIRAADDGIVSGVGNNKFAPSNTLSMAEFTVILVRAFFPDELAAAKDTSTWYSAAKEVALNNRLLQYTSYYRVGTETFMQSCIRNDMASMMSNVLLKKGIKVPADTTVSIPDYDSIPILYQPFVEQMMRAGILTGVDSVGTFSGDSLVDRAQATAIYCRLADYIAKRASEDNKSDKAGEVTPEEEDKKETENVRVNGYSEATGWNAYARWVGVAAQNYDYCDVLGGTYGDRGGPDWYLYHYLLGTNEKAVGEFEEYFKSLSETTYMTAGKFLEGIRLEMACGYQFVLGTPTYEGFYDRLVSKFGVWDDDRVIKTAEFSEISLVMTEYLSSFDLDWSRCSAAHIPYQYRNTEQKAEMLAMYEETLRLINEARAAEGLNPLVMNTELNELMEGRAVECDETHAHTRPNGEEAYTYFPTTWQNRFNGENLTWTFSAENAFTRWMDSPGHRENIMRPDSKIISIGKYHSTFVTVFFR